MENISNYYFINRKIQKQNNIFDVINNEYNSKAILKNIILNKYNNQLNVINYNINYNILMMNKNKDKLNNDKLLFMVLNKKLNAQLNNTNHNIEIMQLNQNNLNIIYKNIQFLKSDIRLKALKNINDFAKEKELISNITELDYTKQFLINLFNKNIFSNNNRNFMKSYNCYLNELNKEKSAILKNKKDIKIDLLVNTTFIEYNINNSKNKIHNLLIEKKLLKENKTKLIDNINGEKSLLLDTIKKFKC